ncbi:DUF6344 domain-containing protein [Streptomyces flavofungini]|uniref:Secreted protein n=1 Tax=Streptomyces flavofungini TaxID=68200 RepID=A0ABS0WYB1_9ACTN|nr:DUF6344 domain-containing protein [Streptomyces flavofungini]MBJ3805919.1 hypothetical protein [Streptomyces flavofungini]GHC76030.1 hypothetical protein GCM10010349_55700 [Streptomyces flavofungini]
MTATKAMKLWTALVTAVLALFATLGLTTTATAAAPAHQATTSCESTASMTAPLAALWQAAYERSLPPTMKQRIRAEAHGSTPSCRHLPTTDTEDQSELESPTADQLAAEP